MGLIGYVYSRTRETIRDWRANAAAAGRMLGSYTASTLGSVAQAAFTNVLSREAYYQANKVGPSIVPEPQQIFDLWYRQAISDDEAKQLLGYNGVGWDVGPGDEDDSAATYAWRQLAIVNAPVIDIGTALDFWRQGMFDDDRMRYYLHKSGIVRDAEKDMILTQRGTMDLSTWTGWYQEGRVHPDRYTARLRREGVIDPGEVAVTLDEYQPRPVAQVLSDYRQGVIDRQTADTLVARHGFRLPQERNAILDNPDPLGPLDAITAYYRGGLTVAQLSGQLGAAGLTTDERRQQYMLATTPLPTPSDLTLFAVREVWDQATVNRMGYDEEIPPAYVHWMGRLGFVPPTWDPAVQGGQVPQVNWPEAYWRAHWQLISPSQAYDAFHRLRPGRAQRYLQEIPDITPFERADLDRMLRVADYPPAVRPWLTALAFLPLRLVDVRSAYLSGERNRQWAIDQLRDRGYSIDDAGTAVDTWDAAPALARRRALAAMEANAVRQLVREALQAYSVGILDYDGAKARLADLGVSATAAGPLIGLQGLQVQRAYIARYLASLRKSFLRGALSPQEVAQALQAAAIAPARAQLYLRQWQAELSSSRRALTTQQIVRQVATGLLTRQDAATRLARLGWSDPDAALWLHQADEMGTVLRTRAAAKEISAKKAHSRELAAAARQAQAAVRQAQTQLRRSYPLASLRRQFCLGIRKATTISRMLADQGYSRDAIQGLLLQWTKECEASPPNPDNRVGSEESYNRRQTPLGTIKAWYQNGLVTESWARGRLSAIGITEGARETTLSLWRSTLGKKSGPAPEGTQGASPVIGPDPNSR